MPPASMLRVQGETGKVSNPHGSSEWQGTQLLNGILHLGVAKDSTKGILCPCLPGGIQPAHPPHLLVPS